MFINAFVCVVIYNGSSLRCHGAQADSGVSVCHRLVTSLFTIAYEPPTIELFRFCTEIDYVSIPINSFVFCLGPIILKYFHGAPLIHTVCSVAFVRIFPPGLMCLIHDNRKKSTKRYVLLFPILSRFLGCLAVKFAREVGEFSSM